MGGFRGFQSENGKGRSGHWRVRLEMKRIPFLGGKERITVFGEVEMIRTVKNGSFIASAW